MKDSSSSEILFTDARAALLRDVSRSLSKSAADDAFASWLLADKIASVNLKALSVEAFAGLRSQRVYHHIAIIGFAADTTGLVSTERDALTLGLRWLSGREPFPEGNPMGFCTDAVALLGIALGVRALKDDVITAAVSEWAKKFLLRSDSLPGLHDWQRCLLSTVASLLNGWPAPAMPTGSAVADVRVALRAKGLLSDTDRAVLEGDEIQTLTLLKSETPPDIVPSRAALRVAAFDWIQRTAPTIVPGRATVEDVCNLLRQVANGFRRWTWEEKGRTKGKDAEKWQINNEYHVQNLLYLLLAPLFPDLKDEENFPSVGQKKPRTDLFIPSLKLIIEVKFIYKRNKFPEMIGQIAEDASLYLADASAGYTRIVAFLWDDSRRTEEHALLVSGLKQIAGVVDAVVISRPGVMGDGT